MHRELSDESAQCIQRTYSLVDRFKERKVSLNELAWGMEASLIFTEKTVGEDAAETARNIWFNIEIANAVNLSEGQSVDFLEIDDLAGKFAVSVRQALGAT